MSHIPQSEMGMSDSWAESARHTPDAPDKQRQRGVLAAGIYRSLPTIILALSSLLCLLTLLVGLSNPDFASLSLTTVSLGLATFALLLFAGQRRGWFSTSLRDAATIQYQANVLRHVSDAVISTDLQYVVQSWNQAAADIYGWSEEEAVGRPLLSILQTTYFDTTHEAAQVQFEQNGFWHGEVIQQRRDGSPVFIQSSVRMIRDEKGAPIAVVAANRDVTIQKETERLLQIRLTTEQLIARISADFVNCSVIEIDAMIDQALAEICRFASVDDAAIYLLQPETADVYYPAYRWHMSGLDVPPELLAFKRSDMRLPLVQPGYVYIGSVRDLPPEATAEREIMTASGTQSVIAFALTVKGDLLGFLSLSSYTREYAWDENLIDLFRFVTDIVTSALTRKWAEEALRESKESYQMLVEQSLQGLVVYQDNRIVFANPAVSHITGYQLEELLALSAEATANLLAWQNQELVLQRARDRLAGKSVPPRYEVEMVHKNGTVIWLEIASSRIEYRGMPAIQVVLVDITERKQAEEALRQAQKLESLGVLAGGIAHDFNNLLVAMLGQSSLALTLLPEDSAVRPHILKAVSAAERAADLTQQLLAYSGQGQFLVTPIDLNALIQENLHLLDVALPKEVELRMQLAQPLPLIQADKGQMQQVIMNLLINAAEAIGGQPGVVAVTTGDQMVSPEQVESWQHTGQPQPSGRYVYLQVTDNGCGMDAETLSRIFDPFFTTKFTGRGLGLAAVLGIVRGHKGGLQVESEPQQGTTFRLFFPAVEPVESPVVSAPAASAETGLVLVIDDDAPVREAIADILMLAGWRVIDAESALAGIDQYREHWTDTSLVLLDLSMPGMGGAEVSSALHEINPSVPLVLCSGFGPLEAMRRFAHMPVRAFLQKPFTADQLLDVVRQYART